MYRKLLFLKSKLINSKNKKSNEYQYEFKMFRMMKKQRN